MYKCTYTRIITSSLLSLLPLLAFFFLSLFLLHLLTRFKTRREVRRYGAASPSKKNSSGSPTSSSFLAASDKSSRSPARKDSRLLQSVGTVLTAASTSEFASETTWSVETSGGWIIYDVGCLLQLHYRIYLYQHTCVCVVFDIHTTHNTQHTTHNTQHTRTVYGVRCTVYDSDRGCTICLWAGGATPTISLALGRALAVQSTLTCAIPMTSMH